MVSHPALRYGAAVRVARLFSFAAGGALVFACAAERVPAPTPPVRAEVAAVDAGLDAATEAAPARALNEIRFELAPQAIAKQPSPHVEIQFPFAEQSIRLDKARRYKLRLKVENWPLTEGGRGVDLVLDDFAPKRIRSLDPPIELGQLVPEDSELGAGEHTLVAMAVRENGELVRPPAPGSRAPFALVHFWVGERGSARISPSAPRIVYVRPRGTVNGELAAERILLDFLPIGVELGKGKTSVVVRVRGEHAAGTTVLEAWQPMHLLDVPSGDYRVELELIGADGRPLPERHARAGRTITVNRDAPESGSDGGG
jgi:hypothetical protein